MKTSNASKRTKLIFVTGDVLSFLEKDSAAAIRALSERRSWDLQLTNFSSLDTPFRLQ